jgi:hypothetical protein
MHGATIKKKHKDAKLPLLEDVYEECTVPCILRLSIKWK